MIEHIRAFLGDVRSAARSLARAKGLTVAIVLTLALGIGANAAMFTLVRGILLQPLVNRDESRLIHIRQNADGANTNFSVPEIQDLESRVKTLTSFGDFSVIGFTLTGLGEPRTIRGGVAGGTYLEAMGLHPVLGRLIDARDDGPNAQGAVVLTYRFCRPRSIAILRSSAKRSGSVPLSIRVRPPSSACWSRAFPIRTIPRSFRTSAMP